VQAVQAALVFRRQYLVPRWGEPAAAEVEVMTLLPVRQPMVAALELIILLEIPGKQIKAVAAVVALTQKEQAALVVPVWLSSDTNINKGKINYGTLC